jgi:hypothetical protein
MAGLLQSARNGGFMHLCLRLAATLAAATFVFACNTNTDDAGAAPPSPSSDEAPAGDAPPSADPKPAQSYPAYHDTYPTLVSKGGPVLRSPRFQLVMDPSDADGAVAEQLVRALPGSDYWKATTGEYGVGTPRIVDTAMVAATASSVDDADLRKWLADNVGKSAELAEPDGETVYVFVEPGGVTVTRSGITACGPELGGYHGEAPLGDGRTVPYVVVPRCVKFAGLSGRDVITYALSHELIETTLDPSVDSKPAYATVNDAFSAFTIAFESEAGDVCPFRRAKLGSFVVQQTWSNAAAASAHDPCVPAAGGAYIAAIPVLPDVVQDHGNDVPVVRLAVGDTKTIDLHIVSDGPTGDIELRVVDLGQTITGIEPALTMKLDKATARNGDIVKLTITATRAGQIRKAKNLAGFIVTAKLQDEITMWPALVVN